MVAKAGLDRRQILKLGTAACAAALSAPAIVRAHEVLKVAFVYYGSIGDYGWTYAHELARRSIVAEFGDAIETTFVENVPENETAERVMRELAQRGNQLIFATSFGFMRQTVKVAQQFPEVKFEHATGFQRLENLATYNLRFYQGRAVTGTLAAHMSQTGLAGYVASFPIPEVIMGINAFTLAAQRVNPKFMTRVVWTNNWFNPERETVVAQRLIDQGADIIAQHTDSPAVLKVAEAAGVYGFGQGADMSEFAPNAHLTAIVHNWAPYYAKRVRAVQDGTWRAGDHWSGLGDGTLQIAPFNRNIPRNPRNAAETVRDDIIEGVLDPFAGPINDQIGIEHEPPGGTLSDEQLLSMDWFVEGVQT